MNKINSPYRSITGCAFQYYEYQRLLPLLMDPDSERLLKEEVEQNRFLQINARTARIRFVTEFKHRFSAVPRAFWKQWETLSEEGQRAGLFYAILKTYKLVFDFHFDVTVRKWNSIDHQLTKSDLMMEMNEIAAKDVFVDSWSENTKNRCVSQYLTILRQTGLLEGKENQLHPLHLSSVNSAYYFRSGEEWFFDACLLYPYEVKALKSQLL
jgi:hypothetical protein